MNSSMLKKGSKRGGSSRGRRIFSDENSVHKFNRIKRTNLPADKDDDYCNTRNSQDQAVTHSRSSSPYNVSPMEKSPWSSQRNANIPFEDSDASFSPNVLMGSLVREEGHIYSLAASGDLLYTGSDSKNIRVWKNQKEFPGFKSNSGLVKAIVISGAMIFTGHQDGKIRVWKVSSKDPSIHKRIGTLPTMKDYFKNSMKTSNYIEVKRHSNATFKVWRISNSRCLESVIAHDDAVNSIVAGNDGLVFTGSADGTVKVWRRELQGKGTKHFFSQTLLKQECAVTAVAVNPNSTVVYCGSSDGLVNFWEREKMSHGGVLRGHNGPVKCLAAEKDLESTPNDRRWILYSGSLDKSVKMWRVSEKAPPMAWKGCASSAPTSMPSSLPAATSFPAQTRNIKK
ncbi:hypothetical protein OIU74_004877 [Salix koriyanagi]|uniref:Uncharacterized protein n=1 Tax=Salix koriyanagi TaxID=2511006 RepID=A0A9Q0UMQ8_9ROSI|nr:hypothetical protein OIU74_004877 [Salix koriyanagi]